VFSRHAEYRDAPRTPLGDDAVRWARADVLRAFCRAFCTVDFLSPTTVMIRRDIYDEAGGFDPSLGYHEDLEFFCRVLALGAAKAPDLLIMPHDGYDIKGTFDSVDLTGRGKLVGMHKYDNATLFVRGHRIAVDHASVHDVLPTACSLLQLDCPLEVDGRVVIDT